MPATVYEKWTSRQSQRASEPAQAGDSHQLQFVVLGEDSRDAVETAVRSWLPTDYGELPLASYSFSQIAPEVYEGTATYDREGVEPGEEPPDEEITFDTTGGTETITESLKRRQKAPAQAPGAPVGETGDINDGEDGPQGVDIVAPALAFGVTKYLPAEQVTQSYVLALAELTGSVNATAWRGFADCEVLFLGATGSQRGRDDWQIDFRFAAHKNRTGITIHRLPAVDKKGWEYLWVRYERQVDDNAIPKRITSVPIAVYVERVYPLADFAALGID